VRQFLSFERWPKLAVAELRLDVEILRSAVRQAWVSKRMNARFRRSLAWRRDLLQLLRNPALMESATRDNLGDAPWRRPMNVGTEGEEATRTIADEVRRFVSPSAEFEELAPDILTGYDRRAKVIAFYLPQFHPFPENDEWWGTGFTEWTNVARAVPRFAGHYQPRIPRDLGFYDLRDDYTIRRQIDMAKQAGLFGFCFYYYNFDGKRLLEQPLERFLGDRSLDMPFCLMWANENWTRRWDGAETEILMRQSYTDEMTEQLVDDLARFIDDPRYIRIDGRPLVIIYRPNVIPGAREVVTRWRERFREQHGVNPILFMVQGFGSEDPAEFGFDGAIEFPPHKLFHRVVPVNDKLHIYDKTMSGQVVRYEDFISASLSYPAPQFPLIRTIFPSWDNDARRQGHGMSTVDSSPTLYRYWLDKMIQYAGRHTVHGEKMVFVNAWNEWAEGAYLEPDVHFGGAYLNETARAVGGLRSPMVGQKVLLVGHDAHPHGAQELLWNLADYLKNEFGCEVEILLCGDGPLLERYQALAPTTVVTRDSVGEVVAALAGRGFREAIVNSVASGFVVEPLREQFFKVVTLVHELPKIIRTFDLEAEAVAVAAHSDKLVFPSAVVRDAFATVAGEGRAERIVRPQGLYKRLEGTEADRDAVRAELGLGAGARIVLNVGYGDLRKGIDLFADLAGRMAPGNPDLHFVWVGLTEAPTVAALGEALDHPNLHFIGQRDDVGRLLAAADVFALTSREDPFPSVVLEALAMGLPVVAFEGAGGFVDLFDFPETGRLVALEDTAAMADAIAGELAVEAAEKEASAALRRARIAAGYSFRDYAFGLLQHLDPNLKRISVVVPNYNYARYLEARLTSIFEQTHPIYELIVLDDASTDDSVAEIARVTETSGRRVRLVRNEENSRRVFRQWKKGAELASGDLVWIAEADDLSEVDFLATLAEKLHDPSINLAFSDSSTIDASGVQLSASYRFYYSTIEAGALARPLTLAGTEFAERYLSERNIILNVSAVLWKRSTLLAVLAEQKPDVADEFKVAGDWLLYLRACRLDGSIGYHSRPLNIHRRAHGVTALTRGMIQLDEVQRIHREYERMFGTSAELSQRRASYLEELRRQFEQDGHGERSAASG